VVGRVEPFVFLDTLLNIEKLLRCDTFLGAFAKLRKATISFVMSVRLSNRMEIFGSHWKGFHDIWHKNVFQKSIEKIQVSLKSDKNNSYLNTDLCKFMVIPRWILLRMRIVSDRIIQKVKTYILCQEIFCSKIRAVCLIMWKKNAVQPERSQIRRTSFACWITTATYTHSAYAIFANITKY
jgi:hypothetical protein